MVAQLGDSIEVRITFYAALPWKLTVGLEPLQILMDAASFVHAVD